MKDWLVKTPSRWNALIAYLPTETKSAVTLKFPAACGARSGLDSALPEGPAGVLR